MEEVVLLLLHISDPTSFGLSCYGRWCPLPLCSFHYCCCPHQVHGPTPLDSDGNPTPGHIKWEVKHDKRVVAEGGKDDDDDDSEDISAVYDYEVHGRDDSHESKCTMP